MKKKIMCHKCHKEIMSRADLSVIGNSFNTYHNRCFQEINSGKKKNISAYYSGYRSNGMFTWIMLFILNIAIWSTYILFDSSLREAIIFSVFISAGILFFRVVSYFLYERHFD